MLLPTKLNECFITGDTEARISFFCWRCENNEQWCLSRSLTPLPAHVLMKIGTTYLDLQFKNLLVFPGRIAIGKFIRRLPSVSASLDPVALACQPPEILHFSSRCLRKNRSQTPGCNELIRQLDSCSRDDNISLRFAEFL